jgi:hypothetical protein
MVVPYTVKDEKFVPDKSRQWSQTRITYAGLIRNFDVAPDGKRVLVPQHAQGADRPNHAVLVFNFFEGVRRLAEPGRN